jgi:hypothetical protein
MKIIRILGIILLLLGGAAYLGLSTLNETIRPSPTAIDVKAFQEIPVAFEHRWSKTTHPFSGAAVIDVDGNGAPEIFVGGGEGQDDRLLEFRDGMLVDSGINFGTASRQATYGATAIDLDNDGDVDLTVARNDGVYLHLNEGSKFTSKKVPITFGKDEVPMSVAVADVNGDGHADLYVSVFISFPAFKSSTFNDPGHAKKNRLLLNKGDLTFTDITASSGTASKQNTFTSAFADLDGDRRQDLIVSQNTGEIEMFRNLGGGKFEAMPTSSGYGFWMGLVVGDVDNDGDQDLFFSNLGVSIPTFLTKGDLEENQRHAPEWLLLRNDGGFNFTDVTAEYGLKGYGFSWGAVFEDLNLDGRLDLMVAQNYIKWPLHKIAPLGSKTFLQQFDAGKPGFYHADAFGLDNRHFAQTPLISDLNSDGRPDILWLNMDGPLRAFLNSSGSNFITISVPDTLGYLGASVQVETDKGILYTRQVVGSIGLMSDQTSTLFFGLGDAKNIKRVTLETAQGKKLVIDAPGINQTRHVSDFTEQP